MIPADCNHYTTIVLAADTIDIKPGGSDHPALRYRLQKLLGIDGEMDAVVSGTPQGKQVLLVAHPQFLDGHTIPSMSADHRGWLIILMMLNHHQTQATY